MILKTDNTFRPVTIILDSQKEVDGLFAILSVKGYAEFVDQTLAINSFLDLRNFLREKVNRDNANSLIDLIFSSM